MIENTEIRKCIITGQTAPKKALLRFAVLPDGRLLPDFDKKLGGRGVYLSNSQKLLQELTQKEKPLNKILHKNVLIAAELPQMVEQILQKKALNAINLARKSGALVMGFEKVKDALKKNKVSFVVEAGDAGADSRQKMATYCKDVDIINVFASTEISEALKHENTVFTAILHGHICNMVRDALVRYQTFINN